MERFAVLLKFLPGSICPKKITAENSKLIKEQLEFFKGEKPARLMARRLANGKNCVGVWYWKECIQSDNSWQEVDGSRMLFKDGKFVPNGDK